MSTKSHESNTLLDTMALAGIAVGFAMLVPAAWSPDLRALAFPGYAILLPSLIYGLR